MIYIYFQDDYDDMGGHGLKECATKEEAEAFIQDRMFRDEIERTIDCYTVIEGDELNIKEISAVTKISIQ